MSQPTVNITEINGSLGVLATGEKMHAAVGVASQGATDTPSSFSRTQDVISTFGYGPLVEYACYFIETYRKPILLVRTGQSTAGAPGTINVSGVTGTSVVTITLAPNDDYEVYFKVVAGGTIGVAGITFQWSLDGGRTLSPVTALGTANTYAFPGAGLTQLNFAAGTLVAGDVVTSRTSAPNWNSTELASALLSLSNTAVNWREVFVVGVTDATAFDAIQVKESSWSTAGKPKHWIANCRNPNVAESEATYLSAMNTIFTTKATDYGNMCAGACKLTSSGPSAGRKYRRPASWPIAALSGYVSEEIDIADVNLGSLPGVAIRDVNGNVDEHDETVNPGLDDARFSTLRTWDGISGVYVNRPRIFSAAGSDFSIVPYRQVMNLARESARVYLIRRLNKPILVDSATGRILEEERLDIEDGLDGAMRAVLSAKPKVSGGGYSQGKFVYVSPNDNLLSTKTLTISGRIVPLAYAETINFALGFFNPLLQVSAT